MTTPPIRPTQRISIFRKFFPFLRKKDLPDPPIDPIATQKRQGA
jgi:hypothetical protein